MNPAKTIALLRKAGLSPPETLTIAITPACNLSCAHCWVEAGAIPSAAPVPTEILRTLLQRLNRERATAIPDCQDCSLMQSCTGGCMGRAWGSFGAFLVAEDRCQQHQTVVNWKEKN